jgi:hypothetical protein
VSDNAIALARELRDGFGVDSVFVVLNSTEACNLEFPRFYTTPAQLLETCVKVSDGEAGAALLHYSGYGYSPDGAPVELSAEFERLRRHGQFRMGAYFHELFVRVMPWRSAFWYRSRQQRVARAILNQCDFAATNLRLHYEWLKDKATRSMGDRIHRLPVFSNVGECLEPPSLNTRRPVMVVFGLPATRRKSYAQLSLLTDMLNALGVKEIQDVGPESETPSELNGLSVTQMGELSPAELGTLLSTSAFGFVPHPFDCLAKSGVFAALCANGTIPILGESFSGEVDGLRDGIQLVSPATATSAAAAGLDQCSNAGWRWYMEHRLSIHAQTYSQFLMPSLRMSQMG